MGMITNPDGSLSWDNSTPMPGMDANLFGGVQGLSAGYSGPTSAPNVAGAMPNNPFKYTSWGEAGGFGKYIGANGQLFMAGLGALSQGVGIYTGLKNLSLAKKSFNLQKEAYRTNLANQTQSYNTQVQDRINGRSYATEEERQAALAAAQLPVAGG